MRTRSITAVALMSLMALLAATPAAAAAATPQSQAFEAEVTAAKTAMMGKPELAIKHARAARALTQRNSETKAQSLGLITADWLEGEALIRVNRPDEARPVIERAMTNVTRHAARTKLHADLLKARAALSLVSGAVQPALVDFLAAHELFRELKEPRSQAIVLQNIGSIYLEARDFERALRYYEQASETYSDDPALALAAHNNRGEALKELGRYNEAETEYATALNEAVIIESDLLQARILSNLASAQMLRGDLNTADTTARRGLRITQSSAVGWEPFLWGIRAQIALKRGDLGAAGRFIKQTFAGVDLNKSTLPFRESHDTAREVFFRLGDASTAFKHFTAYKRLDDEARNIASSANAALMTARFDAANQALRIAKLKAGQLENEAEINASRQRLNKLKVIGLIAAMTVLAIFGIGFFAFRAVQRSRDRVSESNVKLNHAARHDALTGLPNRRFVRELLQEQLTASKEQGHHCALILIDLDRFKVINDTCGHEAGDSLLLQVGSRLHEVLPEGARAGRLGGDEFAVVLNDASLPILEQAAGEIVRRLSAPYEINGQTAIIGASVGIAIGEGDVHTVDVLTRNADLALYHSKHTGREKYTFFEARMLVEAEERRQLEGDLRTALIENQFALVYQPIVDASRGQIVAFEALLRWDHPIRGEISPGTFIPIAEEAGLIRQIGEWVLRTACHEAARWPDHIKVAVNLSVVQIEAEGLVSTVVSALAQSGLAAERLEFELTESIFLSDGSTTDKTLDALRSLGVTLALDDFGTGYSSLSYLQRAEFGKIKIDRAFVKAAAEGNEDSLAIIKAIVSMANGLGMVTTAEGVETETERQMVCDLGCSQIQGFLIGRPERREVAPAPAADVLLLKAPVNRRRSSRGSKAA